MMTKKYTAFTPTDASEGGVKIKMSRMAVSGAANRM
jgi:hypothetical protein